MMDEPNTMEVIQALVDNNAQKDCIIKHLVAELSQVKRDLEMSCQKTVTYRKLHEQAVERYVEARAFLVALEQSGNLVSINQFIH